MILEALQVEVPFLIVKFDYGKSKWRKLIDMKPKGFI
jgi:hypothetical protein